MGSPQIETALILCLGLLSASAAVADGSASGPELDLRDAVHAYMEAIDAGSLNGQMAFWTDDSAATPAIMGGIWTGGASIRARSAQYVPISKRVRNVMGPIR